MEKSADISELKEKAERLLRLLTEPEPGLGTWHSAVGGALDAIAEHAPSYEKRVTR